MKNEMTNSFRFWRILWFLVLCHLGTSCQMSPERQYVRQTIPIEIRAGEPIRIEIRSLSGNGPNAVGIRCSEETWNALTNVSNSIMVQLKSTSKSGAEIGGINPGSGYGFLGYVPNVHYLFHIYGKHGAKASVEIVFPNAPEGTTHGEIIVGKTPIDTKPPNF